MSDSPARGSGAGPGQRVFVAAEFSLVTVRKTRIDQLIAEGSRMARPVRRALIQPDRFIAATQLGITMASIGLGWIGEPALASMVHPACRRVPPACRRRRHTLLPSASRLPRSPRCTSCSASWRRKPSRCSIRKKPRCSSRSRPSCSCARSIPFIHVLNRAGAAVVRLFGLRPPSGHGMVHSEEELKMLVTASQEAGVLEEDEEQMLHRVFHFSEFTAGQMMVPRTEMAAVRSDASLAEVVDVVVRGRHTSLPVYREEVDDVIGIVLVTDLVRVLAAPAGDFNVAAIAREALTVPETMKADELLRQMRRHRTHQAIVIDEYGGTAGLVTFERVMERIVGQLGGDFGTASRDITRLSDGSVGSGWPRAGVRHQRAVRAGHRRGNLQHDRRLHARPPRDGVRAWAITVDVAGRMLTVVALDGLRVSRVRSQ